jgi:hypothetical protein
MGTLYSRTLPGRENVLGVQIEPAPDCDGAVCHQPIFREDGSLNYIPPHCHLIEQKGNGVRCYAIFCDFPDGHERPDAPASSVYSDSADSIFANYPPFSEEATYLKRTPI